MTTAAEQAAIPASRADLIDRPLPAVLTTHLPGGRLQSTIVWSDHDGGHLLINTMREFQKARNLPDRPLATVLIVEPGDANPPVNATRRLADRLDVEPLVAGVPISTGTQRRPSRHGHYGPA